MTISRRNFLGGAAALLATQPLSTLSAKAEGPNDSVTSVEAKIHWRDVINLDIKDTLLRQDVAGFLSFFERASFPYNAQDPATGKITQQALSGQDFLAKLKVLVDAYAAKNFYDKAREALPTINFVDGKYTIADHDRPFDGHVQNGCLTLFESVGNITGPWFPVFTQLGRDYLKSAEYRGVDGKFYPVTVDQTVAHELAHVALRNKDEPGPIQVENIIMLAMDGNAVERAPEKNEVHVQGDRHPYLIRFDKINLPERHGMLMTRQAKVLKL